MSRGIEATQAPAAETEINAALIKKPITQKEIAIMVSRILAKVFLENIQFW